MDNKLRIDLTDKDCDLSQYIVSQISPFECAILNGRNQTIRYDGFILAKSSKGKAFTVCDVNFHYSNSDSKFPVRLTFRRTDENFVDKSVPGDKIVQRISFDSGEDGYREFWKMIAFLEKFREIFDIGIFFDDYRIVRDEDLLSLINKKVDAEKLDGVLKLLQESNINERDLQVAILAKERAEDLDCFERLLGDESFRDEYRATHNIKKSGDEAIWHHFFREHQWIFGLGLDLRFMPDLIDEPHLGIADSIGKGSPTADYLGLSDFTTLIEIKKPESKFFKVQKDSSSRSNTWPFTSDFIEAVSQSLAQKDSFLRSVDHEKMVFSGTIVDNERIRTIDPKTILIYGRKDVELPMSRDVDTGIKRDTLERFTRDSRNLAIISFDELLDRARFIVNNEKKTI